MPSLIMQAMDPRPELLLPPQIDSQRIGEITHIADLVCAGRNADQAIAALDTTTGSGYELADFAEYDGSRSLEEFALEASRPA